MALVNCPDCGAQISDTAVVCPQCGFPLRGIVPARAPRFRAGVLRGGTNWVVIAAVAAGIVVVVALGAVAAVAIPRVVTVVKSAKDREGVGLLKQVHALQGEYASRHGIYAPTLEALESIGGAAPAKTRHYTVEIASAELSNLCLNAVPIPGSSARPIRMRTLGEIDYGARCGEFVRSGDVNADATAALRDVYRGIRAWWYEHQRPPETEAELREAYPGLANDPGFVIGLTLLSNGGMCVHIAPRTQPPSAVVFSLDSGGNVYAGDGCAGTRVAQVYR